MTHLITTHPPSPGGYGEAGSTEAQRSGLGLELSSDEIFSRAFDAHAFVPAAFAGNDCYRALGYAQRVGEDFDQLGVGGAINGSSVESDEYGVAACAGYSGSTRARDDSDVDKCVGQARPI